ncbi:type III CRISPR-associated RAMP protein Csx7 [Desulfonema magnum]|uniref:CRISPR type III-associated RAMP domain-containing protein n=1 Tax=Desulfonema magnum TaxID=45655 RepID=A0A975GSH8_9BACT|nr:CRISPR-associated RAMP protein Csx7 [Desulfonema magnum]QTA92054.1 CRISPR type III-associated RAMP domain-containing protein [Desulfonema magnum]
MKNNNKIFRKKVKITGNLVFETAFHIGSGKEGELATDMGVLLERDGRPILPGSSLKGNFRSFAERLAGYLGLKACLLDSDLSGVKCVSDETYRKGVYEEFKEIKQERKKLEWLQDHVCDVCSLFGSPLQASRIFFSDGLLLEWGRGLQVRDGVCIDRDTETARHGAKYDFEVVPRGAAFKITIEIENPEDYELALVGAALAEWEHGFRLGGFTSRGLGKVCFTDRKVEKTDYTDAEQLMDYLISHKMTPADSLLDKSLEDQLLNGGNHA